MVGVSVLVEGSERPVSLNTRSQAAIPAVSIGRGWYVGRRQIKSYSIRRPWGPRRAVAIAFRKRRMRLARRVLDEQVVLFMAGLVAVVVG